MTIQKASQLASQADGETRMHVLGEVHETLTRGKISLIFNALVVKKLNDATILAGMNFLIENKVSQEPHKHRVTVNDKYSIEETPAKFIYSSDAPTSLTVNLKRISVLLPSSSLEVHIPNEYLANSKFVVDSTDQANADKTWLCQEIEAVNRTLKITNQTARPIILGKNKDTSVIKIRPVVSQTRLRSIIDAKYTNQNDNINEFNVRENTLNYVRRINSDHRNLQPPPNDLYIPVKPDPEEYLRKIYIEPNVMSPDQHQRLWSILKEYHEVFDNDISEGYNNESGEFDVDWNWLNDQQPPPGVSKQEVYSNEEMNLLKQEKIDWMESQNICFKAHLLGVPVKYASLTMLVPKASLKDHEGPLNHSLFRFVNLFNQLNEYIALEPSQPESISSVLYEAGQWNFMISGDLTNSFYQRWICKRKLPYMAFHSPYKGMYILARSAQGMKNQSEGLDQMMRVVLGDLIKQGKARKIADDVQAGGETIDEAIDNFERVLKEFQKNNIKMDPKKTRIFSRKLPIFGWIKEGQKLKPDQHSLLAIEKAKKPKTITELRSFLGQYKVFYKNMPRMAASLDKLQQLTGEKDGKQEIVWSKELEEAFENSKKDIKNIQPLYLPKRKDQLAITLDWSGKGIGATLWALLKDKKEIVCYFSSQLKGSQTRWPPCDGEGLAACSAIERFSNYIRESSQPTLICSDNKPVVQAALLLMKGHFSASPRLNKLLGNINTFPIVFHHLSGKMSLNEESDLQSRNPSSCRQEDCPVCQHLLEQSDILDTSMMSINSTKRKLRHIKAEDTFIDQSPCSKECQTCTYLHTFKFDQRMNILENLKTSVNNLQVQDILQGNKPFPYIGNRKVLFQIQRKDPIISKLIHSLQSGGRPTARNTKCNDLKTYLSFSPRLDHDGLVVVDRVLKPTLVSLSVPIIPQNFAKSIMLAAHIKLDHPKPAQFEKLIFRNFCALKIKTLIKELFDNCFTCQADLVAPSEAPIFKTESKPSCPGAYWSSDVMKHGKKNIMVSTDNFSSFTVCSFIDSEKQEDCEKAIISGIFPFKAAAGDVRIRVDTAPGLSAMVNRSNENFIKAGIELEPGDTKNKNSLSKVDKTMAELRTILRTISPDGSPLSLIDLQRATETLNTRVRNSNLSAREIMFSRLQDSNKNISLDDKMLSDAQYERRIKANKSATKSKRIPKIPGLQLYSLVFLKHDPAKDKSKVRDVYIVMEIEEQHEKIKIQKMLNPISTNKGEINNRKLYTVKMTDVYLAPMQHKLKKTSPSHAVVNPSPTKTKCKISQPRKEKGKFYELEGGLQSDEENAIVILLAPSHHKESFHKNLPKEINLIDFTEDETENNPHISLEEIAIDPTINCDGPSEVNLSSNDQLSIWSPQSTEQITRSPITSKENDPDFGHIPLTWDHSSDLSIPMYDTDDDASRLAFAMAEKVLDDEVEEEDDYDEVFDDAILFEADDQQRKSLLPLNLHLVGDDVQRGRVYRLESRLPVPLDLHIRGKEIEPGKVYTLKRLHSSNKPAEKRDMKPKSKKKKAVQWFIKKMTFAKKHPPKKDQDEEPPDVQL